MAVGAESVFSLLFREMIAVHATRRICLKVEFVGVMIQIRYTEERLTSDERSEARRWEAWAVG